MITFSARYESRRALSFHERVVSIHAPRAIKYFRKELISVIFVVRIVFYVKFWWRNMYQNAEIRTLSSGPFRNGADEEERRVSPRRFLSTVSRSAFK